MTRMGWPGSTTPSWSTSRRHDVTVLPPSASAWPVAGSADWLRVARTARILSWLTLAWMGVEGGVAIVAAVLAGSVALLGFGLTAASRPWPVSS